MHESQPVRPLRTEADYEAALAAIRPYFDDEPEPGTPEADRFDLLALVIEKYENEHFSVPEADPVAVVQLVMEANGFTRADLAEILGGAPRVSEFFNRRRELSLSQIRRLRAEWGIPADALIGEAEAA
jgi:HTH-type transcriptional regulator/antitoxin HigA